MQEDVTIDCVMENEYTHCLSSIHGKVSYESCSQYIKDTLFVLLLLRLTSKNFQDNCLLSLHSAGGHRSLGLRTELRFF